MKKSQPITIENVQFNHNFDLEDWDIVNLFKDTIWIEYIDEMNGEGVSRGGIHIPENARSVKDFYRIGRVLDYGPDCSECIDKGVYLLVPPQLGLKGLKKGPNGGSSLFIREELVMAVISPQTEDAVEKKETQI